MFAGLGWSDDAAAMAATTLAYLPKIPAVLLTTYLIDRIGRRALLSTFVPVTAVCLLTLTLTLTTQPSPLTTHHSPSPSPFTLTR